MGEGYSHARSRYSPARYWVWRVSFCLGVLVAQLPSDVTYGRITGTLLLAVKDTPADPDTLPDAVAPVGSVIFVPSIGPLVSFGGDTVIVLQKIEVPITSTGYFEVDLVATSNPVLKPTSFYYTMYIQTDGGNFPARSVTVPPGTTTDIASFYRP